MRRIATAVAFAVLAAAPPAWAQEAAGISPAHVVGVKLGMTRSRATSLLAKPVRVDRLEDGYRRLVSGRQKVEVYFRAGSRGAVVVTTWNRRLRTDEQIGPCSTVAALKRAYGMRLQPFRQGGRVVAYRLGDLVFTVENGTRVGVVALGRGSAATYVALNAPECS